MNIKKNKSIGIWGYGIVGKSATEYFLAKGYRIHIMDKRVFTENEVIEFQKNNILFSSEEHKDTFFNNNDVIFSSPGINVTDYYALFRNKWLHELDIFYRFLKSKIIAITGSVGKTSCTHMLSHMLTSYNIQHCVGGNIGIPTFDLLKKQLHIEYTVLEVSSFQLNYCIEFAPYLSIWTNFYSNHLDYHGTENDYFAAKAKILAYQKENTYSLIPLELRLLIPQPHPHHYRSYFSMQKPDSTIFQEILPHETIYYHNNKTLYRYRHGIITPITHIEDSLTVSFTYNILIIAATLDILQLPSLNCSVLQNSVKLPQHRLEYIGSYDGICFYNDSKSTTMASTTAAVEHLSNRPLHLFLGGLSKGVDRSILISQLKNKVDHIYCFGLEAEQLYEACLYYTIPASYFTTLKHAVDYCFTIIKAGDCVLLSPAGSSYDLYQDYKERGNHFTQMILEYYGTGNIDL